MRIKNRISLIAATVGIMGSLAGIAIYRKWYKMPLKEYTRLALYMAVLDDEIARNTFEGNTVNGETVEFPHPSESLQFRYHMFLQMNRGKTKNEILDEIDRLEGDLHYSRIEKQESEPHDVTVEWGDSETEEETR